MVMKASEGTSGGDKDERFLGLVLEREAKESFDGVCLVTGSKSSILCLNKIKKRWAGFILFV